MYFGRLHQGRERELDIRSDWGMLMTSISKAARIKTCTCGRTLALRAAFCPRCGQLYALETA